nr:hypothetical protein 14 [bacterium]
MTTNKGTLKYLGVFAAVGAVGIGGILYADHRAKTKAEAMALQKNQSRIAECIDLKGKAYNCGRIDLALADEETKNQVSPFIQKWEEEKAAAAEKRKAQFAKMEAAEKERKRLAAEANAKADAKFKAEGWWEAQPGIFVRWCDPDSSCPGRARDHYTDRVWRAMVWCKERACGDIYARMNILNGGTVVGWTNDTGYGSYGQKVVLTFGSHISGNGRIVEFEARG